jgi:hypothetical protein
MLVFMTHQAHAPRASASPLKTYVGSCHCGAVRFEARLDLGAGIGKCNCTICKRTNFLGAKVRPEEFKCISGKDSLTDYLFNSKTVHHLFCSRCGVQAFGHANIPQAGGEYYTVNVHCLEGADITGVPIKYYDGLNNNWWSDAPAFP